MEDSLNQRELDILQYMARGLTDKKISSSLHISHNTVRWYAKKIYAKLDVSNRTEAVTQAQKLGLLVKKAESVASKLPAQVTSFIGRQRELEAIVNALNTHRLLTLTGTGGVGKTRLSLEVARHVASNFADGVVQVDLTAITDHHLVLKTISQALGIGDTIKEKDQLPTVQRALASREMLMLIDNFEHVIEAVPIISQLLKKAPHLKLLVTSREALRLQGEQQFFVPPLAIPDEDCQLDEAQSYDAIKLFVQRAQLVNPAFTLNAGNIADVIAICEKVDGLPLAIELVAAQSKMMTPKMLLEYLKNGLDGIPAKIRDLPLRQQTIRNTIDWSYKLLTIDEKCLFRRLAVFRGGFSLSAIEAICCHDIKENGREIIASLIDKSLIQTVETPLPEMRFVLLETVHEYTRELLAKHSEDDDLRERHAQFYLALSERAEYELRLSDQYIWYRQFTYEYENIRVALDWALVNNSELGLRMLASLRDFWFYEAHHIEGQEWLEKFAPYIQNANPILQGRLYVLSGLLAYGRQQNIAEKYQTEALKIFQEVNHIPSVAWTQVFLAFAYEAHPDAYNDGIELCHDALRLLYDIDDLPGIAWAQNVLGNLLRLKGDLGQAQKVYEACLQLCREIGDKRRVSMVLGNLAIIAEVNKDYRYAEKLLRESITLAHEIEFNYTIPAKVSLMAGVLAGENKLKEATQLLSASLAMNESMGIVAQPNTQQVIDRYIVLLKGKLDVLSFQQYWAQGRQMSLDSAVAYIRDKL